MERQTHTFLLHQGHPQRGIEYLTTDLVFIVLFFSGASVTREMVIAIRSPSVSFTKLFSKDVSIRFPLGVVVVFQHLL